VAVQLFLCSGFEMSGKGLDRFTGRPRQEEQDDIGLGNAGE
jgi:hypothetical protein